MRSTTRVRTKDCSLADGELGAHGGDVPCHFAEFDIRTGAGARPAGHRAAQVYPVRVQGSDLQVEF